MKLSTPFGALLLAASFPALLNPSSAQAISITGDASATNPPSDTQVAPALAPAPEHPPAPRFSPGVNDVLKMLQAKVDPDIIKAYIKNSTTPYNLSAAEIIELKNRGVPDEILATLVQHGADVRSQTVTPTQSPPYATAPYPMASQYQYQYPQYPEVYSDYGSPYYAGYPYYYPYSYWWYNYSYPWWGFSYSYSPYCHFDGHGYCHYHHGYHSGHYGNYYGHGGNGHSGNAGWNRSAQAQNHSSPFGTFNGRNSGFSGTRSMSPFAPYRTGFATGGSRPSSGFSAPRTAAFSAPRAASFSSARPASFASHVGGFRSGGGFAGRGGGGGHR